MLYPISCLRSIHLFSVCQRGQSRIGHIDFTDSSTIVQFADFQWLTQVLHSLFHVDLLNNAKTFAYQLYEYFLSQNPVLVFQGKHQLWSLHPWRSNDYRIINICFVGFKPYEAQHLFQFQKASAYHSPKYSWDQWLW